jgi:hypothetical protein
MPTHTTAPFCTPAVHVLQTKPPSACCPWGVLSFWGPLVGGSRHRGLDGPTCRRGPDREGGLVRTFSRAKLTLGFQWPGLSDREPARHSQAAAFPASAAHEIATDWDQWPPGLNETLCLVLQRIDVLRLPGRRQRAINVGAAWGWPARQRAADDRARRMSIPGPYGCTRRRNQRPGPEMQPCSQPTRPLRQTVIPTSKTMGGS